MALDKKVRISNEFIRSINLVDDQDNEEILIQQIAAVATLDIQAAAAVKKGTPARTRRLQAQAHYAEVAR